MAPRMIMDYVEVPPMRGVTRKHPESSAECASSSRPSIKRVVLKVSEQKHYQKLQEEALRYKRKVKRVRTGARKMLEMVEEEVAKAEKKRAALDEAVRAAKEREGSIEV
ncbi:hypothetical protein BJ138DRAFT_1130415 [Hygrophoropsis aurantiaca]|uniref:Uncharacterized protein n=1 Tax=Hygrophoropsis aurantiaca TaxID=72124 RepID=A0ACB7ZWY5_9AGAM|nr:hypothetical protein BJ138DRAFT_1130415 [Hygrophoropsis aurantiaca]